MQSQVISKAIHEWSISNCVSYISLSFVNFLYIQYAVAESVYGTIYM